MANPSLEKTMVVLSLLMASISIASCFHHSAVAAKFRSSGYLRGKMKPQHHRSPPIVGETGAHMTINSFAKGGEGGGASECDERYHSDSEMVVALSTRWYNKGRRCLKNIKINANGKTVMAKVVDECDSVHGSPPCPNNIVDASPAVWKALRIPKGQIGDYDITWSDA